MLNSGQLKILISTMRVVQVPTKYIYILNPLTDLNPTYGAIWDLDLSTFGPQNKVTQVDFDLDCN